MLDVAEVEDEDSCHGVLFAKPTAPTTIPNPAKTIPVQRLIFTRDLLIVQLGILLGCNGREAQ